MASKVVLSFLIVFSLSYGVKGVPKGGLQTLELPLTTGTDPKLQNAVIGVRCTNIGLFKGSTISLGGKAQVPDGSTVKLTLKVFKSGCANLPMFNCDQCPPGSQGINHFTNIATNTLTLTSSKPDIYSFNGDNTVYFNETGNMCGYTQGNPDDTDTKGTVSPPPATSPQGNTDQETPTTAPAKQPTNVSAANKRQAAQAPRVTMAPKKEAVYINVQSGIFVVQVEGQMVSSGQNKNLTSNIVLNFELKNPHGYLSAVDFPALVFFGIMTGLYAIYAVAWLIVLGLNYTDLVRLQFWILGVVLLGFLEKALFLAEYDAVNQGRELHLLIVLAVVVSAVKRALSRMLLVIVALGYGIVRPRLGDSLTKVIGAGVVYFIIATINGVLRARNDTASSNDTLVLLSYALLIFIDFVIMCWIFSSIVETRRTLRIRKNLVKLSLYNHFSYVLIFSIVAALGFVIWDLFAHLFPSQNCLTDWGEVWLHDCFWHVLFAIILGMIMIIWRPGSNKKRFAYSLVDNEDADDDESVEQGTNKNFESVKMRQVGSTSEPPPPSSQAEEDLRWVEENLPTSAIDKALPLILDSDEELMTSKFESSKIN